MGEEGRKVDGDDIISEKPSIGSVVMGFCG
jgi:hypothetical protein